jgi:4-hydroxy-3-polyprenylbenzoate decarboxylase
MKLVVAGTGASGAIYLQRLLARLDPAAHEVHLVLSSPAKQVIAEELGSLRIPPGIKEHGDRTMRVPFVSGSARFDAMVVIPCSMGTLGRIAAGTGESTILRAADVFLKERRKLILVPRETPWSLIHARNVVTLLEAGAVILPAIPHFYSNPQTVEAVADTVVERVLDQLGVETAGAFRWSESERT